MKCHWLVAPVIAVTVFAGSFFGLSASCAAGLDGTLVREATSDHRKFQQLKDPLTRGPEVTKVCLSCHTEAAKQVQQSVHWTWERKSSRDNKVVGKAYILNNF